MADSNDYTASQFTRNHERCLVEALASLRTQEDADIILVCGNFEFYAHKNVLKANSPYFRAMFQSNMIEATSGKIVFKAMEPETLELILDVIYSGDVSKINCEESLLNVLEASHLLQLERLFQYCCKNLLKFLNPQNFHNIWKIAEKYSRQDICTEVLHFVVMNISEVIENSEFLQISIDKMRCLLKFSNHNPHIMNDMLLGVVKWLCHDQELHEVFAYELLAEINVNFVSKSVMKSLLANEVIVLPTWILTQMNLLGWPILLDGHNPDLLLVNRVSDECKDVKLVVFSPCYMKKKFDPVLKRVVECKVIENCVQILDIHSMTWQPLQMLPPITFVGAAMCQYKDKIYIVGDQLTSYYIVYDLRTNSVECISCTAPFHCYLPTGFLCAVKDCLYFVGQHKDGTFQVMSIKPRAQTALGRSSWITGTLITVVASPDRIFIYYKYASKTYSRYVESQDEEVTCVGERQVHYIPTTEVCFFANFNDCQYGLYQAKSQLIQLKYDVKSPNGVAKVLPENISAIKEVTTINRSFRENTSTNNLSSVTQSSQDYKSLMMVSTEESLHQIPTYLFDPETCKWLKLPLPKGQCYIPHDAKIQKVYFDDNNCS